MSTMPEAYYVAWEKLYQAERRAFRERRWEAWRRAARRLVAHENAHGTAPRGKGQESTRTWQH